ncbi:MAG: hypothetical protein QX197_13330 [Methylococcaceae bacterium]
MSSSISSKQTKLLSQRSGDRCAFFDCRRLLSADSSGFDDAAILGEMAHIAGEKSGVKGKNNTSARYDETMTDEQRNNYENLIYLCREHHRLIDEQENTYSVTLLLKMKADHEQWVRLSLAQAMPEVSFQELEEVTKHLLATPSQPETQYLLTPPREKMRRNGLTEQTESYIRYGMIKSEEVRGFIQTKTLIDSNFSERLKAGFLTQYYSYIQQSYKGDELFEALCNFSSGNNHDFKRQAAGIAVLVYLFEDCEVFER